MTDEKGENSRDSSMLDLFRLEVDTHTTILNEGLLVLEHNPHALDKLEALMRAAHSVKGGARIVGLDAAVKIAHAMEDCFVAVQNGRGILGSEQIDVLLKGVDILGAISETAAKGNTDWAITHQEEIDAIVTAIAGLLILETSSEVEDPSLQENSSGAQLTGSSSYSHQDRISSGDVIAEEEFPDASMLELFRSEVETHTTILRYGLVEFQNNPSDTAKLDPLIRASHAIQGGAQIVELDVIVEIAHIIEEYLVAIRSKKILLQAEHIHILLKALDMLRTIADITCQGNTQWLAEHQEEIHNLIERLSIIYTRESSVTVRSTQYLSPQLPILQKPSDEEPFQQMSVERERIVRVAAAKIERLMGLTAEVVISSRWLPSFFESLLELQKNQRTLGIVLEKLREVLRNEEDVEHIRELVLQARQRNKEYNVLFADKLNQFEMFSSTSANLSDRLYQEVISLRMRPFADGIQGFPRMIRDLAKELGKKVRLEIMGKATEVDRDILEKLDAPLTHLLRNAVDHGIESPEERVAVGKPETGTLRLEASHWSGMLLITVADDGRGIDLESLRQSILHKELANADIVERLTESELMKFLFLPGFSTAENVTEISGRGVGLDVVETMVHEVAGVIRADFKPGQGSTFYLELPLTLSVVPTFLVDIAGELYAFPLTRIDRCLILSRKDLVTVEDHQYFTFNATNIALVNVHDVLELEKPVHQRDELRIVIVRERSNVYGLLVDKFVGEVDLVVHPLDPRLGKVPNISAMAVMLDGSPVLIFDVEDLVHSIDRRLNGGRLRKLDQLPDETPEILPKRILVVDDSITVREMERKLLENKGYHVEVAVDGMAGWNLVRTEHFDLVISDVDMPRMNGIEFVTQIKQDGHLKSLPVIIVSYKDTEEHRLQGLRAGANYYLTKSSFQDESFIEAVVDLIGKG